MFRSKSTHNSKTIPGVRFTIRHLNKLQRDRRDMQIHEHVIRWGELHMKALHLQKPYLKKERPKDVKPLLEQLHDKIGQVWSEQDHESLVIAHQGLLDTENASIPEMPDDVAMQIGDLKVQLDRIESMHFQPATLTAALISIEEQQDGEWVPYLIDGEKATAEVLIESGADALKDEISSIVDSFAAMSPKDAENFLLQLDSPAPAAGDKGITTATPVTESDTSAAATAPSTIPT